MVIANDHYQSIEIVRLSVSEAFNVLRVKLRFHGTDTDIDSDTDTDILADFRVISCRIMSNCPSVTSQRSIETAE